MLSVGSSNPKTAWPSASASSSVRLYGSPVRGSGCARLTYTMSGLWAIGRPVVPLTTRIEMLYREGPAADTAVGGLDEPTQPHSPQWVRCSKSVRCTAKQYTTPGLGWYLCSMLGMLPMQLPIADAPLFRISARS